MQRCPDEKTNPISSGTGAILRVRVRATPNHQNEPNYLRVTRPGSRFHSPRTAKTNPIRSLHPSSIASVSPKSRKRTQFLIHAFKNEPNSRQPETPAPERSEDPDVIVPTTLPERATTTVLYHSLPLPRRMCRSFWGLISYNVPSGNGLPPLVSGSAVDILPDSHRANDLGDRECQLS